MNRPLREQLDALAVALTRLPPGPFREDCCDKHRPELEDARDDGLACYGLYAGDRRVDPDPRALAPLLNAAPALLALVNAAITDWREGPPPGAGQFWVVMWMLNPNRWEVRLVEVSPAVLNPEGRLLLKMSNGSAFLYEPNRYAISHHASVIAPEPPVPLEGRAPPHNPEAAS